MSDNKVQILPAFVDLETVGLDADYGRVLCGSIKHYGQPTVTYRSDDTKSGKAHIWDDRDVVVQIRDAIESSFMIMTWNGIMFDIKYLNSRLMFHEERAIRKPLHKDLLFVAKSNLLCHNHRLQSVQEFLNLAEEKTRLQPHMWVRAMAGDREAMNYVVEHCEADVAVTELAFERLVPFIREIHTGG